MPTAPTGVRTIVMLLTLVALAVSTQVAPTHAQTDLSEALNEVAWDAPAACPEPADIRNRVRALLGPASTPREPLTARARVSADHAGYTARIELRARGASESKVIQAEDCATVGDAYALIVAFTLDPSGSAAGRAPAGGASRAVSSSERAPRSKPVWRAGRRPFALGAAAVGALGVGQLPFPALGVGARLNAGRLVYGELGALYWPPRHQAVATPEGNAGADVSLITVESAVCVPVVREALAACLGAAAGSMRAAGTGVPNPSEARAPWVSANAALTTLLPIGGKFALRFRFALGVPFQRARFVLDELGAQAETRTAFRPEAVYGTFSLEPELRFFSTDSSRPGHATR